MLGPEIMKVLLVVLLMNVLLVDALIACSVYFLVRSKLIGLINGNQSLVRKEVRRTFSSRKRQTGTNGAVIEHQVKGVVKKWFDEKGFGFITPDDRTGDVFVHHSQLQMTGRRYLEEGDGVEFDVVKTEEGRLQAQNVNKLFSETLEN